MRPTVRKIPPSPHRRTTALFGLRITFSGILCVAIVVLVGLAALNSEANLLFLLFGISLGVVGFSALASAVMVRKVDVERIAPAAVVAGRPFTIVYCMRSRRRWLRSWSLVIGEIPAGGAPARFPLGFVEALGPGGEERIELTGVCPARGRVPLAGMRLLSRFPFGLFACTVDVTQPGEMVVLPAVGRFRRDPWRDRRHSQSTSSRSSPRESRGMEEFYGVREYRPGDNTRWIHWRRSARVGQLIVRESTVARAEHLTVLLDPWPEIEPGEDSGSPGGAARSTSHWALRWLTSPVGDRRRARRAPGIADRPAASVERIINLAATALCEGLERGHRVGLIARGAVPVVIAPSGGRSHRQRLLHELALLKPGATEGLDALVSRIRWSSGWHGRCMICATHLTSPHTRVMRFLTGRAEAVVAIGSDSDAFDSLFDVGPGPHGDPAPAEGKPVTAGRGR
jgi:uncharacterized protein (DUF58 family)